MVQSYFKTQKVAHKDVFQVYLYVVTKKTPTFFRWDSTFKHLIQDQFLSYVYEST